VRRTAVLLAAIALVAAAAASAASSAPAVKRPARVTMIGDSVSAALDYVDTARRYLGRGLDFNFVLDVCRRLVAPSCTYQGVTPATGLQVVLGAGRSLGRLVVIDVGYNDYASTYRSDLDRVMRALVAAKVRTVVWVTLRETRGNYVVINSVIRAARKRWPQLVVADWNAYSRGHDSWFGDSEGLHLSGDGAMGLARLLRPIVLTHL
jgi:hypothetical protein